MLAPALVLAIAVGVPTPADRSPEAVMRAATEAAHAGDLARARAILETAHARDPLPAYLFARIVLEREAGDCGAAIASLERFLATAPSAEDAAAAEGIVADCRRGPGDVPETTAPQATAPSSTVPPPTLPRTDHVDTIPARAPTRRVRDDPWGASLVGAGSVLSVIGAALLVGADVGRRRSDSAGSEAAFADRIHRARTLHGAGIGVVVTGAALVIAGAIRYGVLVHRRARTDPRVTRGPSWATRD